MPWRLRFWRRVRVAPGVTVNVSKSGPSLSVGPRGSKVTVGRKGIRQTLGIPGTGLFATNYEPWAAPGPHNDQQIELVPGEGGSPPVMSEGVSDKPPSVPAAVTHCGFCGAKANRGSRCPMCNQPV
jgi:hypothetical protein